MKRYTFLLLTLLLLVPFLVLPLLLVRGCGTLEVGVEKTPTPDYAATATVAALATENARLATQVATLATATPTANLGKVAYLQGGDIWVKALPNGEPQRLTTDGLNREPGWSPSGQWLAFRKGDFQVWVMGADGSEAHPLNEGATVGAFAWAPMTDRLAYVVRDNELQAINADDTGLAILVLQSPYSQIGQVAWSPDGAWIAYEWRWQGEGQPPEKSIHKASVDGKERIQLYPSYPSGSSEIGGPLLVGWTSDSRFLLVQSDMGSASLLADGSPLYAIPADGGTPVQLADFVLAHPDFVVPKATDPTQVAAIVGSYRGAWTNKALHLLSVSAGEGMALTSLDVAVSSPTWSPDSQKIAYVAMPDQGDLGGGEPAHQALMQRHLFIVNAQGTPQPLRLTDDQAYRDELPLWSADGSHILFARLNTEDQASLWLVPAEGGDPLQVVNDLTPAPEWFGYYGHIDWDSLFDWWTGLHQTSDCSTLPPAMTPTLGGDLSVTEEGGAAQQVAIEFLQSVLAGDVEKALTYWNLEQPDQPANYGEFIRQMVSEWARDEHRFVVGQTTYGGLVGPRDYRPLDEDDPRVQGATVAVHIDDLEGALSLSKVNSRWFIEGLMVTDEFPHHGADSGPVYLKEGMIDLLDESGEQPIGPLPEGAGHLALGPRYLAYIQGNRIQALSLTEGTTHMLVEFPDRASQDFDLRWSNDGSTLAYSVAWHEPDGSRIVELGTSDGYEQRVVDTLVARPAGPTPTPPPEPPMPPEPGFANLHILGFDWASGRLVVMPVGGQEGKTRMWTYDLRQGQRVQEQWWPTAVVPPLIPALSPDLTLLAAAQPGVLQIYQAERIGTDWTYVELPAAMHATWLSWSPDTQQLAYLLNEGASPGLDVSPSLGLWVWEAESGQARQLSLAISPEAVLHGWTADGKAVVLEALDGISRQVTVSLVDVATEQVTPLPLPEGSRVLGWIGGVFDNG